MSFTHGNDINILQSTDMPVVSAGAGDDVYILDDAVLDPYQDITISDPLGENTIHLVNGLVIQDVKVTDSAIEFVFNNGAKVDVLSADTFDFLLGGDSITGEGGQTQTFYDFVTQTLGLPGIPAPGSIAEAQNIGIIIGGPQYNVINVYDNQTFSGTPGPDEFKFDAVAALQDVSGENTQATITYFDPSQDYLYITLPTPDSSITNLADLNGKEGITVQYSPFHNATVINFGNDQNGGEAVTVTMDGITQDEWSDVVVNYPPLYPYHGGGGQYNVINVYDNQTFSGTSGPDEFKFDVVAALQDINGENTQATITNFDPSQDILSIIESQANSNVHTLADLDGVDGISVAYDAFNNDTIIDFGNDQNGGEPVIVALVGITPDEWGDVHVDIVS